jgi:hypothetical protein
VDGCRFRRAHDHIFEFFEILAACRRHGFGSFYRSIGPAKSVA